MDRELIFNMFNGQCAYCGSEIIREQFQVDHIHASARGGPDENGNYYPACRSCNASKATYTIEEFRKRLIDDVDRMRRDSAKFRILERFGIIKQARTSLTFLFERMPAKGKE